jgi:predicted permease
MMETLTRDLRYAVRMLFKSPGFTLVALLTLALGIGANTSMFTLVDAVLLRAIPVSHPEQLVAIGDPSRTSSVSQGSARVDLLSYPMYTDLRDNNNHLVTGLLASGRTGRLDANLADSGRVLEHPRGRFVSANYFQVLGVPAAAGRTFDGTEDRAVGAAPVVVISNGYWTRRLARDPRAIGKTMTIDGADVAIIGVAPASFTGEIVGTSTDIWIPLSMQPVMQPNRKMLEDRSTSWLLSLGRLAPGVTVAQAQAGFGALLQRALIDYPIPGQALTPEQIRRMRIFVDAGDKGFSRVRELYARPLVTLLIGVGLLLLIICANVANLLLARAVARGREMSVRLAVGAGRARLVRQLLTESMVLGLLGAAAGLLVAWWGSQLLLWMASDGASTIPLVLRLDLPVLAFTLVLSVVAVVVFGLAPALRASRADLASTMRSGARSLAGGGGGLGARGQRAPLGKMLIAGQVALSLVLLVGAALLVRSLQKIQTASVGLDRDHLLVVDVDIAARGYSGDRLSNLAVDLSARLGRLPGVAAVSWSENGLFSGTESANTVQVTGFTARDYSDTVAFYDQVGAGYARAVGAQLLMGRDFTDLDREHAPPVTLINETMARFYWPGESAIGKSIRISDSNSVTVVGVVRDIQDHELDAAPVRRFYLSYLQHPVGEAGSLRFEVRATGDPAALSNRVRREIAAADPQLPVGGVDALTFLMRQSIQRERLLTRLAAGFGGFALLLAAIGLYGVMTYAITRRTNEIGLRVALGARQLDVVRMVLGDALRLVALGVVVGIPLAIGAAQLLRNQLHGIGATDPAALGVALGVLAVSAVVAALLPALKAAGVAPVVALREE